MEDKYKKQYEQFSKEQHRQRSKWDESDPVPYMPKEWATKKKMSESLKYAEKKYVWTPTLQSLEDILWAS